MIILGYQGIGKSTVSNDRCLCHHKYIDLESSNFFVNGSRQDNWARIYCNIAEHLSLQHSYVFMSTHQVVRDTLAQDMMSGDVDSNAILTICPALSLKDDWIAKLKSRYNSNKSDKNYKAYRNAVARYDENIQELIDFSKDTRSGLIVIDDMNYSLTDLMYQYCNSLSRLI